MRFPLIVRFFSALTKVGKICLKKKSKSGKPMLFTLDITASGGGVRFKCNLYEIGENCVALVSLQQISGTNFAKVIFF